MNRRKYLASAGALTIGLSGCLGGKSDSGTTDPDPDDGYPAESAVESTPESRDVDTGSFETITAGGVDVPLVPVDVAHYWYQRREARFADARGSRQYDSSHVTGAVLSSARKAEDWSSSRADAPTASWPKDGRIVCYCGCPHHLSSLRAGEFISKDYEEVYAIDEGFYGWRDKGYPTTGSSADRASYVIRGRTDPDDAGQYAWASHAERDQQEAAPIEDDGSYRLHLHFTDLDAAAPIYLQTPSYDLTAPLGDLVDTVVTGPT